jgi:myosin heavy subunit
MTRRITQPWRRVTPLVVAMAVALISACGPSEEELRLEELTTEMSSANAIIDSLNYTVESANLLIDEMRSRVDSLQQVDQKLLESVQRLNREVREWQVIASDRKRMNEQLTAELERMKREKQSDQRSIDNLRAQADSINTALLTAHTSIRRQEDHLKRMDLELSQSRDEVALLRQAETSVRVYVATEDYLKDNGYLDSGRSLGRAFRKSYKLIKRIDPSDPRMQLAPIGEPLLIEGKINVLVDRFGTIKKGDSYSTQKGEEDRIEVTFTDDLLGGSDVLVVLKN